MKILYATETGNARDVAERLGRECSRATISNDDTDTTTTTTTTTADVNNIDVSVLSVDAYDPRLLPREEDLLFFVCSTMGQGEPPKSFEKFWKFLLKKKLPLGTSLPNLRFAVFGLGY